IVELGLECTQLVVGLLGLESPLLAALGEVGHLVLELLEGDLEGLMLALPKVPALAEEPNQRARSAPAVLGCPLWSPSRRLAGKGSVHACLLLPHPWEHPKLAPAQQKKQNLARSNWQSRSTFHGARLRVMVVWRLSVARIVCLHTGTMGVHPACFFTDRAGKVATPERNLAGKHSSHLVYPSLLSRTNWRAPGKFDGAKLPSLRPVRRSEEHTSE